MCQRCRIEWKGYISKGVTNPEFSDFPFCRDYVAYSVAVIFDDWVGRSASSIDLMQVLQEVQPRRHLTCREESSGPHAPFPPSQGPCPSAHSHHLASKVYQRISVYVSVAFSTVHGEVVPPLLLIRLLGPRIV